MGRQWLILAFTVGRMLLAIGMVAHIMACIWFGLGQACDSVSHGWSRDSMDRHTGFTENDEDAQSLWPVLDMQWQTPLFLASVCFHIRIDFKIKQGATICLAAFFCWGGGGCFYRVYIWKLE